MGVCNAPYIIWPRFLTRFYQDFFKILSRFYQDSIKIISRFYQDSIKILIPRFQPPKIQNKSFIQKNPFNSELVFVTSNKGLKIKIIIFFSILFYFSCKYNIS